MNKYRRIIAIAGCLLILTACATNDFYQSVTHAEGVSIRNSNVFVYSFLDIRDAEFGPQLLAEFDKQFVQELHTAGITAKVLRFKDSETGKFFALSNSGMQIPVKETIARNQDAERSMGADYRLIVFPSKMALSGGWKIYDVRWDLVDAKTGKAIWSGSSHGKHMNAWKYDENAEDRAKTIVDGAMSELKRRNLL